MEVSNEPTTTVLIISELTLQSAYADASTHSDTPMWRNEKLLALAMIPIIPGAIMFPSAPMDYLLSTALVMHCHWYVWLAAFALCIVHRG